MTAFDSELGIDSKQHLHFIYYICMLIVHRRNENICPVLKYLSNYK